MGTRDLPDIYIRRLRPCSARGRVHIAMYIRQIPSAHVTINILHFRGLLYLIMADKKCDCGV